ncbi:hypothetical protein [Streptomyces sp. ITFR-16]|uniref:hypothetical protein n=1 Tax=Streptomyces sp. ITFR-16 TaxID=3075198 RepID=UPI00288C05F7|nr:hypothetical protein [Streptomyces sp. ITFR-16]WNI23607.1 hypothetical protein RLT58_17515 [Streptomyces sp. ITFR-16]
MSTARNQRLKSLPATPTGPGLAGPAPAAPVAVRPDPHTITVTGIQPGLTVRGLGRNEVPVADWLCTCGRHERARGRRAVIELTSRTGVGKCPHTGPAANRSAA